MASHSHTSCSTNAAPLCFTYWEPEYPSLLLFLVMLHHQPSSLRSCDSCLFHRSPTCHVHTSSSSTTAQRTDFHHLTSAGPARAPHEAWAPLPHSIAPIPLLLSHTSESHLCLTHLTGVHPLSLLLHGQPGTPSHYSSLPAPQPPPLLTPFHSPHSRAPPHIPAVSQHSPLPLQPGSPSAPHSLAAPHSLSSSFP